MTGAALAGAVVVGLGVGHAANRLAARYPRNEARHRRLAVRPPALELAGAAALLLVALRFGVGALTPAWCWFTGIGLLLAVVDLRTLTLPNRVVLAAVVVAAALLTIAALATGDGGSLLRAAAAAAVASASLLLTALIAPAGLGMGDVKLALLLGLLLGWLGWPSVVLGFFLAFLAQGLVGLVLLLARRVGLRTGLPFGPALLAGTFAAALLSGGWVLLPGGG